MPRGVYTRTPRPPKTYPAAMVAEAEELYASGLTQAEVAMRIGTTQKVVHRLMTVHSPTAPGIGSWGMRCASTWPNG